MSMIKCKMCGGTLEIKENETIAICEYCQTKQTLPKLDDDRKINLYERASHFRRNNEFDKAMGIYEQILEEDTTDAESYWSLVLCRYGIEYVEDPATKKRIPTVNRAQFTSVYDDDNYKSALEYADSQQRELYEKEAKAINEIQKGILAISQKEEPFDIFICYKETDKDGRRTPDSVLANDLYHQLKQEGFKVFFARITLEDKLGSAYEPYIFAALNSSKVMVVLGTKQEHFNAVWVKNEWSRYLSLIKNGGNKTLIPCYRDMDPYDLPDEFAHLQAQDMSKLGFMQDLIRGIKKITGSEKTVSKTVSSVNNSKIEPLLKRAFIFIEDGDWKSADEYCERVLDIDPENSEAYIAKLLIDLKINKRENLANQEESFEENGNYQKAVRFADTQAATVMKGYAEKIKNNRFEKIYSEAFKIFKDSEDEKELKYAKTQFETIREYKDSESLAQKCFEKAETVRNDGIYNKAVELMSSKDKVLTEQRENLLLKAIDEFYVIENWKDSSEKIAECKREIEKIRIEKEEKERQQKEIERKYKRNKLIGKIIVALCIIGVIGYIVLHFAVIRPAMNYKKAQEALANGDKVHAMELFFEAGDYKDSVEQLDKITGRKHTVIADNQNTIALKNDNTAVAVGLNMNGEANVQDWADIVSLHKGGTATFGIKSDRTVVSQGLKVYDSQSNYYGQNEVSDWTDIVDVSGEYDYTIGLKVDGTIVTKGENSFDQYSHSTNIQSEVLTWTDIVEIETSYNYAVGLKADGTIVATEVGKSEYYDYLYEAADNWTDVISLSASDAIVAGLKADGTVYVANLNPEHVNVNTSKWTDIVQIDVYDAHIVGLKSDGTVVATGENFAEQCNVEKWKDIVAVSTDYAHTVGLKSDGTLVGTRYTGYEDPGEMPLYCGQCEFQDWKDIKLPE